MNGSSRFHNQIVQAMCGWGRNRTAEPAPCVKLLEFAWECLSLREVFTTLPYTKRTVQLTKRVITVPKTEIEKRETQWKNGRKQHKSHHRHR